LEIPYELVASADGAVHVCGFLSSVVPLGGKNRVKIACMDCHHLTDIVTNMISKYKPELFDLLLVSSYGYRDMVVMCFVLLDSSG